MLSWQHGVSMWHRGCKVQRRVKQEGGVPGIYERMCKALQGQERPRHRGMGSHLESKPESLQRRRSIGPSHTEHADPPLHPLPALPFIFLSMCIKHLLCSIPDGHRDTGRNKTWWDIWLGREQLSIMKVLKWRIQLHNNVGSFIMWTKTFMCVRSFSLLLTAFTLTSDN